MAKARKTRRARQRPATRRTQMRPAAAGKEEAAVVQKPAAVSFAEEYQYVIADLKRIFVLAVVMLVLLVVLALVLQ